MSIYMSRAELEEISEGLITTYANKFSNRVIQSIDIEHFIIFGQVEKANFYSNLFLQNLFIKAKSWEHEKEYRIVYPLDENSKGMNVPIHRLGMRTSRIHPEQYTIDYVR